MHRHSPREGAQLRRKLSLRSADRVRGDLGQTSVIHFRRTHAVVAEKSRGVEESMTETVEAGNQEARTSSAIFLVAWLLLNHVLSDWGQVALDDDGGDCGSQDERRSVE